MVEAERREVVVYSRAGCCLCDDALEVLAGLKDELALDIAVRDIAADPALEAEYGMSIPVVFVNGKLLFKGHVDADRLRRRLRGGGILARLSERLGFRVGHTD